MKRKKVKREEEGRKEGRESGWPEEGRGGAPVVNGVVKQKEVDLDLDDEVELGFDDKWRNDNICWPLVKILRLILSTFIFVQ